jgi:ubiquinone/menaquinone biosynthesis C-methylase UbiE
MLTRVLEPEAMDTFEETAEYDAMDHRGVNERFVADFLAAHGAWRGGEALDVGTGTARIPIELCRASAQIRVHAVDLAAHMLAQAARNVAAEGLQVRIRLDLQDAKGMTVPDGAYEAVLSNTIVHHVPLPGAALAEMTRKVAPGGTLFIRDLARPASLADLQRLVKTYAGAESPRAQALYAASLHAALTLEEVKALASALGLPPEGITMTSDRHWTWVWHRPFARVEAPLDAD